MRLLLSLVLSFVLLLVVSGCATVFSGYTSDIDIRNAPDSLQVFTQDGTRLAPPSYKLKSVHVYDASAAGFRTVERVDSSICTVRVRSNRDYILYLKASGTEHIYREYAKIDLWYVALDCVFGGIPIIVDAITGNWNYYDPIDFAK